MLRAPIRVFAKERGGFVVCERVLVEREKSLPPLLTNSLARVLTLL